MKTPPAIDVNTLIPTVPEVARILNAKLHFEPMQKTPERDSWNKSHFRETPWGIAFLCSVASSKGVAKNDVALKSFIIAIVLGWEELVIQLKRNLKNWGYSAEDIQNIANEAWLAPDKMSKLIEVVTKCVEATPEASGVKEGLEANLEKLLTEDIEKHDKLNAKLFTKNEVLKENVRKKMLEIVNEFVSNLAEQNIEIKIDDVLFVGSNANYNYTKDSDIDLHIIAATKNSKYPTEIADSLYSAYRTLFNKNLDINIYDIPLELYVETEITPRNSNGVYSVKKDKWIKKPVHEEIPDYDKKALEKLVTKWEAKCVKLLDKVDADTLKDEKQVVKLIKELYEKLRKVGIAKSEYALENLAFKELRNRGYLDKLKDSKHILISKRLSLEETFNLQARNKVINELAKAAYGNRPQFQNDNKTFYIYNLKQRDINSVLNNIKRLPFVVDVHANENSKYDFSNPLELAMNRMPNKYYNIRGQIDETLI